MDYRKTAQEIYDHVGKKERKHHFRGALCNKASSGHCG